MALTVVGEVAPLRLKRRSGGKPGDVVAVTGPLGASRAGLEIVRHPIAVERSVRAAALAAYETPEPRVREGRWLAASRNVHAMLDSSDGLSTDLGRLAAASGCGATLSSLAIHPAAEAVAAPPAPTRASMRLTGARTSN